MFRPLRNVLRLLGIARTLARYDALFPADWLPATGGLVFMARLLSGFRTAPDIRGLRDGERLARALQVVAVLQHQARTKQGEERRVLLARIAAIHEARGADGAAVASTLVRTAREEWSMSSREN